MHAESVNHATLEKITRLNSFAALIKRSGHLSGSARGFTFGEQNNSPLIGRVYFLNGGASVAFGMCETLM